MSKVGQDVNLGIPHKLQQTMMKFIRSIIKPKAQQAQRPFVVFTPPTTSKLERIFAMDEEAITSRKYLERNKGEGVTIRQPVPPPRPLVSMKRLLQMKKKELERINKEFEARLKL